MIKDKRMVLQNAFELFRLKSLESCFPKFIEHEDCYEVSYWATELRNRQAQFFYFNNIPKKGQYVVGNTGGLGSTFDIVGRFTGEIKGKELEIEFFDEKLKEHKILIKDWRLLKED